MPIDVVASLRQNILRVFAQDKKQFKTAQEKLEDSVVLDAEIKDSDSVAQTLKKLISSVTSSPLSKVRINILVDPSDVVLRFIASNKKEGSFEEYMVTEMKAKLEGKNLDDYYFSYEKLAPFVYQMEAIRKDTMEKLLEVADKTGVSLYSIVPWALFLPKYVGASEPAIFIIQGDDKKVLVLSELQGIFFTGVFSDDTTEEELNKLVHELAFYKREKPIKRVYTLGCSDVKLVGDYKIAAIDLPGDNVSVDLGFELHVLCDNMLENPDRYTSNQLNLLSLLPLPVVEKKANALVYVGTVVGILLLVVGAGFGYTRYSKGRPATVEPKQDQNVLSETNVVQETTPVVQATESTASQPITPPLDLKTSDLKVRIENAAGVNGLAGKTQTFLEKFGYQVDSIATADKEQEPTTLRFKKAKAIFKDLLTTDMKEKFPKIVVEETLSDDQKYDVLILIGASAKL